MASNILDVAVSHLFPDADYGLLGVQVCHLHRHYIWKWFGFGLKVTSVAPNFLYSYHVFKTVSTRF